MAKINTLSVNLKKGLSHTILSRRAKVWWYLNIRQTNRHGVFIVQKAWTTLGTTVRTLKWQQAGRQIRGSACEHVTRVSAPESAASSCNCMEQSYSSEADSCSTGQETLHLSWNPKVHHCVHKDYYFTHSAKSQSAQVTAGYLASISREFLRPAVPFWFPSSKVSVSALQQETTRNPLRRRTGITDWMIILKLFLAK
jgi:hypothetical protein